MEPVAKEPRKVSSRILGLVVSASGVWVAFAIRQALVHLFHLDLPPYLTFYPAVILAALFYGLWPGCIAAALSLVFIDYYIFPPVHHFGVASPSQAVSLFLFFSICIFLSGIAEHYRRAQRRIAALETGRAEEGLRTSQATLAAALESMTDAVFISDAAGNFVQFNQAFAAFYKFRSKEEYVRTFNDFPEILDVFMASGERAPLEMWAVPRALRGETANNTEYTLRRKDTGETWVGSYSFAPIRDASGTITGAVVTARNITENKRNESRLRRFYETDLFAILYWKIDGGVVDVNDRFLEMTGYSREDLRAGLLNWSEITPPEYWALDEDARRQIRETGVHLPYEKEFIRKDGTRVWGLFSAAAYQDDRSQGISFILDITKRKQAEEALRASELRFRSLFQNAAHPIYLTEVTGPFIAVNPATCKLLGYSEEEMLASSFLDLTFPEDRPATLQNMSRFLAREVSSLQFEKRYVHKSGRPVWCDTCVVPIWNPDGTSYFITQTHDITARKQAEEALRSSQEQLQAIIDGAPDTVVFLKDIDGRFITVNSRFEEILGSSRDDVRGKTDYDLVTRERADYYRANDQLVLATGRPIRIEELALQADGKELTFLANKFPLADASGKLYAVCSISVDITERKRAEDRFRKLNRTLKALSNSNHAILHATDESAFWEKICRIITQDCGYAMVWIGVAEKDENRTVRPVAHSGFEQGYLDTLNITWDESERGCGPTGRAIRTGEPSICRNMRTDPQFAPWRENAIKRGYASSLVIPLKEGGDAWGAITIYSRETDAFSTDEINLLTDLAGDAEFGIQTLRLRSAHARAEAALIQGKELLELFVEHAPAALAMFDTEMRYLTASRRWMTNFSLGDRDLRGVSHYDVFPEIPSEWKEAHRRGLAGEVMGSDADRFERADGSEQWVRWEIRPWRAAEGKVGGIVIFSEEITERKKAEAELLKTEKLAFERKQLQALTARLQQVREEERKKIARDLHDQIGQILTAVKMDAAWVMRHLPDAEDGVRDRLAGSIELINNGVRSVRSICSGLRPGVLDDLGLGAAIEWQACEFASRTGISSNVSLPPAELHLDGDRSTAIFRIFQECLTNVARHAKAKMVCTSLYEEDENLLLVVEDDGKGFSKSETTRSLGVLGMKERAQGFGGDVQLSSCPGKGTTVTVRVPVRSPNIESEDHAHPDSR